MAHDLMRKTPWLLIFDMWPERLGGGGVTGALCAAYLGSQDTQETFVFTGLVESWRAVFFMFLNFKILRRDFRCG